MTRLLNEPLVVNGWTLFAHPVFLDQVTALVAQVEALRKKHPRVYKAKNATKRLAAIEKLVFEVIPQNPGYAGYRLGGALGKEHRHWFRAKFFQQYRLFFRYHRASRIIVYAWVNDEKTKRAYESTGDAYRVFGRMLQSGRPPDDWETLLREAKAIRSSSTTP